MDIVFRSDRIVCAARRNRPGNPVLRFTPVPDSGGNDGSFEIDLFGITERALAATGESIPRESLEEDAALARAVRRSISQDTDILIKLSRDRKLVPYRERKNRIELDKN